MRIIFKILAILCLISVFGWLKQGDVFYSGILVGLIFAYLGWKPINKKTIQKDDSLPTDFSQKFSYQEKLSVIRLSWLMAGINETTLVKSQTVLKNIYSLLSLDFDSDVLQQSRKISSENACAYLNKHSEKDWVISNLYLISLSDEVFEEDDRKLLLMYSEWLGFSEEEVSVIITKTKNIGIDYNINNH